MADPQGNGFLMMENKVWEALARTRIPGQARQVLDVIIRKTRGFNKDRDAIAYSQFTAATGIDRKLIPRAINILLKMRLIHRFTDIKNDVRGITSYSFERDYDKWRVTSNMMLTSKKVKGDIKYVSKVTSKKMSTKDITTKDSIQKTQRLSRKPREVISPDHKPFIEFWMKAYEDRFGVVYNFKGAKDGSIVSRLLKVYGLEKLQQMATLFFETNDDWLEKAGYTLGTFSKKDNALAQQVSKKADDFDEFAGRSSSVPY